MADRITLTAEDGHDFEAWRSAPDRPTGGIVVLHAIYGMTSHMADVCDLYAEAGIAAIAPSLYDRSGRGTVFGYDAAGRAGGMARRETLGEATVLADVAAALDSLRPSGPVAVQGFCTGRTWPWIAAARLATLTDEQHEKFIPLCPDFVVELRSPSDGLSAVHDKMREYMENGARLGWLIDPPGRQIFVYRPDSPPERLEAPASVSADPVLPGFSLETDEIL